MSSSTEEGKEEEHKNWKKILKTTGILNSSLDAYNLDQDLFSMGYTLEQLMELAGLSVAEAVYKYIPPTSTTSGNTHTPSIRILVVCGPGNNGGDGLVAARHLLLYGYDVTVVYPTATTKKDLTSTHYGKLIQQCQLFHIPIVDTMPPLYNITSEEEEKEEVFFDCIIDAIFGFSFQIHRPIQEPYQSWIKSMIHVQNKIKIISIDIPSGWDIQKGDELQLGLYPHVLVSLTVPKLCAQFYKKKHYVGGRFIPPCIATKYHIQMPPYKGCDQVYDYDDVDDSDE